jgi:uncharacterized protein with ParB-like and HNH nuclease domain
MKDNCKEEIYNNELTDIEDTKEGIERSDNEPYPWNPDLIRVDTKQFSIQQTVDMIKDKELDIAPDFQRNKVWKEKQKTLLIESILLRIPIPVFYFSSDKEGRMVVVDGIQRLSAINDFITGELKLSNILYLKELDGKTYSELEGNWVRRIKTTQLTANIIDPQTPPRVKYDIFNRINTGGTPLVPQEIRHCLSTAETRKLLKDMSEDENFQNAARKKLVNDPRMLDRELALRFCAFLIIEEKIFGEDVLTNRKESGDKERLCLADYSSFDEYLDDANELIGELSDGHRKRLLGLFKVSAKNTYAVFGDASYTKMKIKLLNKALFESVSIGMAFCMPEKIVANKGIIYENFEKLLEDDRFHSAISSSTHSKERVAVRFNKIKELLEAYK